MADAATLLMTTSVTVYLDTQAAIVRPVSEDFLQLIWNHNYIILTLMCVYHFFYKLTRIQQNFQMRKYFPRMIIFSRFGFLYLFPLFIM